MLLAVTAVCSLALVSAVRGDDEPPSFKKRGTNEKAFAQDVGLAILKAAHPTGKKAAMEKYELSDLKAGRKEMRLNLEYSGAVTGRKYKAEVVLTIDSTNPDAWEVLDIEYKDTNNIPENKKNLADLKKKFNR
jgi:hypothetical protein